MTETFRCGLAWLRCVPRHWGNQFSPFFCQTETWLSVSITTKNYLPPVCVNIPPYCSPTPSTVFFSGWLSDSECHPFFPIIVPKMLMSQNCSLANWHCYSTTQITGGIYQWLPSVTPNHMPKFMLWPKVQFSMVTRSWLIFYIPPCFKASQKLWNLLYSDFFQWHLHSGSVWNPLVSFPQWVGGQLMCFHTHLIRLLCLIFTLARWQVTSCQFNRWRCIYSPAKFYLGQIDIIG